MIQTDADLEVIFHCRRDFPKVRTTELFAKLEDIVASSGGSNPIPPSVDIGGSSSSAPVAQLYRELVTTVDNNPRTPLMGGQISEPEGVEEALCEDEEDEPKLVPEDSNNDDPSIPVPRRELASSESHQYPEHFSSLDIEVVAPTHEA
ncbi:hypothetical protein PIB30_079062, partial [Stylosanthes scabra]|nr:hypothetical protein [Stylosanthes scabra]